jgi:hypothetical protein
LKIEIKREEIIFSSFFIYRTYAKKGYNLDGIVGAYSYVGEAYAIACGNLRYAPTLGTFCVSPEKFG